MLKLLIVLVLLCSPSFSEAVVNLTWDPPCGITFNFTQYEVFRKLQAELDYRSLGFTPDLTRLFVDSNHPTTGFGDYLVASGGQFGATSNVLRVDYSQMPPNTPPTITPIPDQTVAEDTSGSVTFTIGDAETPVAMLNVTASSSNTTVVASSGLFFSGVEPNLTLIVTPVLNAVGSTVIIVTVSDGQLTADEAFMFTTTTVNDPPTITSIANQTVAMNTTVGPLSFTVDDVDTPVNSLTLTATSSNTTLIPVSNITFSGTGASRTVTLTPVTGQTGATTITLTVSDSLLTASTFFTVTVNAVNNLTWSANTATWNNVPTPVQSDWVGMYVVGTNDSQYMPNWFYTSTCFQFSQSPPLASGSCSMPIPAGTASGTQLELRLFTANSFNRLYTSPIFVAP